jgi:DNA-binding transcriptional ArsR family regulator
MSPAATAASRRAALDEDFLDRVFFALANRTRRRILDVLAQAPGCTVGDVAGRFDMSRIGVLKHLSALEEADLVISARNGRERQLWLNAVPLQLVHERWSEQYRDFWSKRLTRLKYATEREGSR